jgi:cytochrome c5
MIRSPKIPFFQSRASYSLMLTTGLIVGVAIFLPMGPYAEYIKLQPLPLLYFACLPMILLGYMICTQLMKNYYTRHFGWQ